MTVRVASSAVLAPTDNVWSITIIQRASGLVTVLPVNAPDALHQKVLELLRRELQRQPTSLVNT